MSCWLIMTLECIDEASSLKFEEPLTYHHDTNILKASATLFKQHISDRCVATRLTRNLQTSYNFFLQHNRNVVDTQKYIFAEWAITVCSTTDSWSLCSTIDTIHKSRCYRLASDLTAWWTPYIITASEQVICDR